VDTQAHWRLIQKRQLPDAPFVALDQVDGFEPQDTPLEINFSNGGIKGKRPSKKDKLRAANLKAENPSTVKIDGETYPVA
jgi:ATP-dependent RNA helicase RhlE